jgi:xylulokinase
VTDDDLCVSVDLGTGGPKVALVSLDGEVVSFAIHHVPTEFGDDGAATQDARLWWSLITEATKRLLASSPGAAQRVKAVAVTGQYASTVPVDALGIPTGPCLTWLDTRGAPHSQRAVGGPVQGYNPKKALRFIRKTAGAPSTSGADPVGQILYLMAAEPELVRRTAWFMEPVDYLTMRFSGVASATHASRLALWMTDTRNLERYDYDSTLLAASGLSRERLPPLVRFGQVIGTVTTDVAQDLGLNRDTLVVTGVPDLHAAAIGSGATDLYDAHLALSTTSWISCPVGEKKTDVLHSIATVPGLSNDSYLVINNQETGARALQWLRDTLVGAGALWSFDEITALAATSPVGAKGVIFTPWLTGERSPVEDKSARAGFTNLSVTSNTADLVRSVLEGVAANSAWLLPYVEKFVGCALSPLRLLGGGAQSPLWCQIYADTLDREVEQVREPMLAQLRGAALLASVSLGRRSLSDIATHVAPGITFGPDPQARDAYRAREDELSSLFARDREWRRRRARTRSSPR